MFIAGLQKLTLIDYPGKLACTVFFTGCNFRCPFCYSKELVLPEEIKKQPKISKKDFFDFLRKRKGFLEGVVLCGGEPCLNKDLPEFSKKIKDLGFAVKLDTNGSNPKMLKKLIEDDLIDYVAMDIKSPKEKYDFYSGNKADFKEIQKSIDILKKRKVDYEFRTTIAPGLEKGDIINIADWIGGDLRHQIKKPKYFLQEFNSQKPILNPKILNLSILRRKEIEEVVEKIKTKFQICKLR